MGRVYCSECKYFRDISKSAYYCGWMDTNMHQCWHPSNIKDNNNEANPIYRTILMLNTPEEKNAHNSCQYYEEGKINAR